MKSSKGAKVKPSEEECGIWLDTKELKEKKQKQRARPISRLLNPLDRSAYSVAVALNFTQTKLNMPVTRQSSISTFFSPKSRDTHTRAKRKHGSLETSVDATNQTSDMKMQNCDGDLKELSSKDKKEQRFLHLICGDEQPPEKRRHVGHYTHQNVLETQEYWTKATQNESPNEAIPETEAFFHGESQNRKYSEELFISDPKNAHTRILGDQKATVLKSVNEKRILQAYGVTNKNQDAKTKASPMKRMGKENIWPTSPIKTTSPYKTKFTSSPAKKCRLKEKHTFPPNRESCKEHETVSALFTQDSEGLCVIAHREKETEENGDDENRASLGEDESDPEMLFTQDSEGNMVIKH